MSSPHYFRFLGTVWDYLPEEDKQRLAETWHAYEQVIAATYQQFSEVSLSIAVKNMVQYNTERWLPYDFNDSNFVAKPAIFTSTQDLSQGVNLNGQYLVKLSVDNGAPIEIDLRGVNPLTTTIFEIQSKINTAFGFQLARAVTDNSLLQLVSTTLGPDSKITFHIPSDPLLDASEFVFGILQSQLPLTVPEYPWVYSLPYQSVWSVPSLRDSVRDESVTVDLAFGVDFTIEREFKNIRFKEQPLPRLWAKRTLFDKETPWNNFGFLMEIYQPNKPTYLSVVQGLWFAFWNGPKPDNLRKSLYLLFGLPTAQEDSTVTSVSPTLIETTSDNGVIRPFEVPTGLVPIVTVGERVTMFQPLVDGIDVFDKINRPGFVRDEVGRAGIQRFLTENASVGSGDTDETKALRLLEEHTFLPQISVDAFISPDIDLGSVKVFLEAIKPLNKAFLFQVIVGTFQDELVVGEKLGFDIGIDITPNLDSNQTTFTDQTTLTNYETSDNSALDLDSDGFQFQEEVAIEVRSFSTLIDSFNA